MRPKDLIERLEKDEGEVFVSELFNLLRRRYKADAALFDGYYVIDAKGMEVLHHKCYDKNNHWVHSRAREWQGYGRKPKVAKVEAFITEIIDVEPEK
jgi:hypothetical protein